MKRVLTLRQSPPFGLTRHFAFTQLFEPDSSKVLYLEASLLCASDPSKVRQVPKTWEVFCY